MTNMIHKFNERRVDLANNLLRTINEFSSKRYLLDLVASIDSLAQLTRKIKTKYENVERKTNRLSPKGYENLLSIIEQIIKLEDRIDDSEEGIIYENVQEGAE